MAVVIETTLGDITVDLFTKERPHTCMNFLKLCKIKYYNFCLFHSVQHNFIAQTGDPTGSGMGGQSVFGIIHGEQSKYYEGEVMPKIKHTKPGLISMVNCGNNMLGSQFFITLGAELQSLDGEHCVFGEVTEGSELLLKLNEAICDAQHRPYQDIRITHIVILEDPFDDPPNLVIPDRSPEPSNETLQNSRIAPDEEIDETKGRSLEELEEIQKEREAKAQATILEIVGDLPDAEVAPPENVLFVCKLNPVTTDDDLQIIFSRFGKIKSCEVIRDKISGDSLQYAFIEFEDQKSCEDAYFKMGDSLIDDRRIHVDFSQSVSKLRWKGKGRGVEHLDVDDEAGSYKHKPFQKYNNSGRNYHGRSRTPSDDRGRRRTDPDDRWSMEDFSSVRHGDSHHRKREDYNESRRARHQESSERDRRTDRGDSHRSRDHRDSSTRKRDGSSDRNKAGSSSRRDRERHRSDRRTENGDRGRWESSHRLDPRKSDRDKGDRGGERDSKDKYKEKRDRISVDGRDNSKEEEKKSEVPKDKKKDQGRASTSKENKKTTVSCTEDSSDALSRNGDGKHDSLLPDHTEHEAQQHTVSTNIVETCQRNSSEDTPEQQSTETASHLTKEKTSERDTSWEPSSKKMIEKEHRSDISKKIPQAASTTSVEKESLKKKYVQKSEDVHPGGHGKQNDTDTKVKTESNDKLDSSVDSKVKEIIDADGKHIKKGDRRHSEDTEGEASKSKSRPNHCEETDEVTKLKKEDKIDDGRSYIKIKKEKELKTEDKKKKRRSQESPSRPRKKRKREISTSTDSSSSDTSSDSDSSSSESDSSEATKRKKKKSSKKAVLVSRKLKKRLKNVKASKKKSRRKKDVDTESSSVDSSDSDAKSKKRMKLKKKRKRKRQSSEDSSSDEDDRKKKRKRKVSHRRKKKVSSSDESDTDSESSDSSSDSEMHRTSKKHSRKPAEKKHKKAKKHITKLKNHAPRKKSQRSTSKTSSSEEANSGTEVKKVSNKSHSSPSRKKSRKNTDKEGSSGSS